MRLIDADLLMEQYNLKDATKYGNKDSKQQEHSYSTMMLYEIAGMIEDAPTAYDVEKVVTKIKRSSGNGYRDIDGDYVPPMIETKEAIDIVRGGRE